MRGGVHARRRRCLTSEVSKTNATVLVSCKLDYCLLYNVTNRELNRPQGVEQMNKFRLMGLLTDGPSDKKMTDFLTNGPSD